MDSPIELPLSYPTFQQAHAAIIAVTTPFGALPTAAQAAQQVPGAYAVMWLDARKVRETGMNRSTYEQLLDLQQWHGFGIYATAQAIQNAWAYDKAHVPLWMPVA